MQIIKRFRFEIIIVAVVALLFALNYQSGTYLAGWDNLQTDLNPFLGIKRAFFSVWEEYQSMGLVAGMGHAADLVRAVGIWLLSFVLPQELLRYAFHFLMFLSGGLGMLKLLELAGFTGSKKRYAFAGALFYLFNFEITQMMFFPFEPFSVFVGLLPWEIWIFLKVISQKATLKHWLLLLGINLLATPQGVAQQLFVVYMMLLGLLSLGQIYTVRTKTTVLKALFAGLLIVTANSFWLAPQVYFLATSGSVVTESKINQLATQDVFYANKDKGNLNNFLRFEGFFYDRVDQNQQQLFADWKDFRNNQFITIAIYSLTLISLLGIFFRSKYRPGFLLFFIVILISLLSNTQPLTFLNEIIRQNSFINQIFRSPFTKFSIPFALIAAYFFAVSLERLDQHRKLSLKKISLHPAFVLGLGLVLLTTIPSFQGQNISDVMQVSIPQPYKDAISYFSHVDKNKRIALLPEYTFWGWYHNQWGYDGSGFLWYGIEQPIISRTFDVWSLTSESYFWELKTALEAEDATALEKIFEKYNVDYVLFDTSLLPIVSSTKGIQYQSIDRLLAKTTNLSKEKEWGFLRLYKINHTTPVKSFVSVSSTLPNIGPSITVTNHDNAYTQHGPYQTDPSKPFDLYYPFLDLTTQTKLAHKTWSISESANLWKVSSTVPPELAQAELKVSTSAAIDLYVNSQATKFVLPISAARTDKSVSLSFAKFNLDTFTPSSAYITNCSEQYGDSEGIRTEVIGKKLKVISRFGTAGCFSFADAQLDQRYGYLVTIEHTNEEGQPFFFYILDQTKDQAYVEDRLEKKTEHYILGSKYTGGLGYNFTFQDTSLPTIPAINTLSRLDVDLLPFNEIKATTLQNPSYQEAPVDFSSDFNAVKEHYYRYTISLPAKGPSTLILHQAYHPGWNAYVVPQNPSFLEKTFPYLFSKKLTAHVKVNNWENGWTVPQAADNQTIILLFLPQYLQFVGMLSLLPLLVVIIGGFKFFSGTKLDRN